MTKIQQQAEKVLKSLNKSVTAELDKKRRLGQYAVVWKNGKVAYLFKENIETKDAT
jgi:glucose-6-phosphate 1-dehydrogenase